MSRSIELKTIRAHTGSHRNAFEELTFLLFAREKKEAGTIRRRDGAGGDGGFEGTVTDQGGKVVAGIQAKFFDQTLGPTQWRDLSESVKTILDDPANKEGLSEVIIALPRNLSQQQEQKWRALLVAWNQWANQKAYLAEIRWTLWDESTIRGMLLKPRHRGLLLHFFEYPDFDSERCNKVSSAAIRQLGDRYLPKLHTATEAEDQVHTFLRSERSRLQYMEEGREALPKCLSCRQVEDSWPTHIKSLHGVVIQALRLIRQHLGDGTTLPSSLIALASALEHAAQALEPLLTELRKLVPVTPPKDRETWDSYTDRRSVEEETYDSFSDTRYTLLSFADYLHQHSAADAQCLLLHGGPGLGKTHVLAEICTRYMDQGGIVVFMEGAAFISSDSPLSQIMRRFDFPGISVRDFLATLEALGDSTSLKPLICIDALNETPERGYWKVNLPSLASELASYPSIKLIVSCRADYKQQTLPTGLIEGSSSAWAFAEHTGLGVNVLDALPKYLEAFDVRGFALPPMTREFKVPLFLRIFCEAYSGQTPPAGTPSLALILRNFVERKASFIASRIDCDSSQVAGALSDLCRAMAEAHPHMLSKSSAHQICQSRHAIPVSSKSLYQALVSEGILAEFPTEVGDILAGEEKVRFTYERVWDYLFSLHLMPLGQTPDSKLLGLARDQSWLRSHSGLLSMLSIRLPEEQREEFCDIVCGQNEPHHQLLGSFMESLSWRTHQSMTQRAIALFSHIGDKGMLRHELEHLASYAINPSHPWNAFWLHEVLSAMPMNERDREWTFWVNQSLLEWSGGWALDEMQQWANKGDLKRVPDDQLLLLAIALSWCLSTTVVQKRQELVVSLTRVLAGRTPVASKLLNLFVSVNDPYVKERVFMACAGAAQHADVGDRALGEMADCVHREMFSGEEVQPHLLVRHYAAEICIQAEQKGVLPISIYKNSFRPPWRSKWPRVWSAKKVESIKKKLGHQRVNYLYHSVEPESGGFYGDWGRYVMGSYVHKFQNRRLSEPAQPGRSGAFDDQIAKRYVIQRVFELGWDHKCDDTHPPGAGEYGGKNRVERLSKKYQWIALWELLGHLCDHYHFTGWNDRVVVFQSTKQVASGDLLDPYVMEAPLAQSTDNWSFVPDTAPWWRGHVNLLTRPLSHDEQKIRAVETGHEDPRQLIVLNDGVQDWIALSGFHKWYEPLPVWESTSALSETRVSVNWAFQSYLVTAESEAVLLTNLSKQHVYNGQLWFHEPEYCESMATLRQFPDGMRRMERRCSLDIWPEAKSWHSAAVSTTCRFAVDEDEKRAKTGSMPSPQLAKIGGLRWTGRAFDFAREDSSDVVVKHFGRGFEGTCAAQRGSLLDWLAASGLKIVWRAFSEKMRLGEHHPDCHARAYWASIRLTSDGRLELVKGGTMQYPSAYHEVEKLPWPRFLESVRHQ